MAYGGDHALDYDKTNVELDLPKTFYLGLCRIEPENNVHLILEAFSQSTQKLVFVGNWRNSEYGRQLKKRYNKLSNIELLEPIYDTDILFFSVRVRLFMFTVILQEVPIRRLLK